jgi:hypothetical protein
VQSFLADTLPKSCSAFLNNFFFFFIKCKYCIDQNVARQACETSWKPAVHRNINIQAKGKQNRIAWGNSLPPSTRENQPKQTNRQL